MEAADHHDNMSLRVASFSYYLDTAKENLVHRVSAQDQTPIPLSSAKTKPSTKTPPFSIKFSHSKDSQDSLTNLRVDSFSYLNTTSGDSNFVFEVPGPIQDPTSAFSFSQEIPKDGEISVFGADKYFNMKLEYQTDKLQQKNYKNEGPVILPSRIGSNISSKTPSLYSEASSWNSQTALLPNLPRIGSQTKQKKPIGRKIFTGLISCRPGRPCFDKKSVHINEIVPHGERIINPGTENMMITVKNNQMEVPNLDESRPSIEVFGSSTRSKEDAVATNMERKLSMLTWDAIPKLGQITRPTSTVGSNYNSTTICDDMASDASSDLFEIENIYPILSSELPTDDMSTCMSPTSHYAPSEASIQWSVVTASAADYSVVSDYNDETSVSVASDVNSRNNAINRNTKTTKIGGKEAQKSRPGGLLGCKSQKAVDVAENVCHKSNAIEKAKINHQSLDYGKSSQARLQLPRSFANGGLSA